MKRMPLSGFNAHSQTYDDGASIVRILNNDVAQVVNQMHDSGLLEMLIAQELVMPILDFQKLSKGEIFVRQKKAFLTYPSEWTAQMLAEAGLAFLELEGVLKNKGYGLIDGHPCNFVFENRKPKFVDLGSFKIIRESERLFPEIEFLSTYIIPLRMKDSGYVGLSKVLINLEKHQTVSVDEYLRIYFGFWGIFLTKLNQIVNGRFLSVYFLPRLNSNSTNPLKRRVHTLLNWCFQFASSARLKKYKRFLTRKIRHGKDESLWGKYDELFEITPRFDFIAKKIFELNPSTILDIGGNSGKFGEVLLQEMKNLEKYILLDKNEASINRAYQRRGENLSRFEIAVFDFTEPWTTANTRNFSERFKSDLVLCLALTHHLIFSGGMSLQSIAERLWSLTERVLMVEFMPLGLWYDGVSDFSLPQSYTLEHFRTALEEYFVVNEVFELEKNRTILICVPR